MAGQPVVLQLRASRIKGNPDRRRSPGQPVGRGRDQDQHEAPGQRDRQPKRNEPATGICGSTASGQAFALPFTNPTALAPLTKNFVWHCEGQNPRVLMDFEQSLIDIMQKYRSTFDAAGRKDLMAQYNNIFTKNVYNMGVFVGRYGLGTAKRVKNIPDGTPVFMYTWVEDAVLLDQLWTPTEAQLKQNRPDTIPTYQVISVAG